MNTWSKSIEFLYFWYFVIRIFVAYDYYLTNAVSVDDRLLRELLSLHVWFHLCLNLFIYLSRLLMKYNNASSQKVSINNLVEMRCLLFRRDYLHMWWWWWFWVVFWFSLIFLRWEMLDWNEKVGKFETMFLKWIYIR